MLKKLQKEKNPPPSNPSLEEEEGDLVMELPPGMDPPKKKKKDAAYAPPQTSGAPKGGEARETRLIKEEMSKLESRQDKTDSLLELNRNAITKVEEQLSDINVNIKDLLAIYEYVSQQFNPFVDQEDQPQAATIGADTPEDQDPFSLEEAHLPGLTPSSTTSTAMTEGETDTYQIKGPLLAKLPMDHVSNVLMLRWIEFLLQRVTRECVAPLLDFYAGVNWISEDVKQELLTFVRGGIPDVTAYEPEKAEELPDLEAAHNEDARHYAPRMVEEWRLTADDHLKSYLFIQRIRGEAIDKDVLNQVELEVRQIKGNLKSYYGI